MGRAQNKKQVFCAEITKADRKFSKTFHFKKISFVFRVFSFVFLVFFSKKGHFQLKQLWKTHEQNLGQIRSTML